MLPKPDLIDRIFNDGSDEDEDEPVDDPLDLDDEETVITAEACPVEPDTEAVKTPVKTRTFEHVVSAASSLLATLNANSGTGLEPVKSADSPVLPVPTEEDLRRAEIDAERHDDAVTARKNLKNMIKHGESLLNSLVLSAAASDDPKFYAAAAQMLKEVSSMNKDLMRLHKQEQELKDMNKAEGAKSNNDGPTTVIDKAVINITPSDLLATLKKKT